MKIRNTIIELINNPHSRTRIASDLKCGEQSVYLHIKRNSPNGRLTKMDALQAISKETNIQLTEILEESEVVKA